jgi:DNA-binding transcriptional ArsR family regulator
MSERMPTFARALRDHRLNGQVDIATIGALIGDDARATMLLALFGGALPASQLAAEAHIGAPAASKHLAKLVAGGLLCVEAHGRERRYRLASPEVAHAIETLASIAPVRSTRTLSERSRLEALREARTCYDHLAGRLGVEVFNALVARGALCSPGALDASVRHRRNAFAHVALGPRAGRVFADLGVDLDVDVSPLPEAASACLDWTEQRPHLSGPLGAELCTALLLRGWILPRPAHRALRLSETGSQGLRDVLGLSLA